MSKAYFNVNPFEDPETFHKLLNERKQSIINQLSSCIALKASIPNNMEFIFHPSTKKHGYFQLSYFDSKGPLSDIERATIPEMAKELVNCDFKVLEVIN